VFLGGWGVRACRLSIRPLTLVLLSIRGRFIFGSLKTFATAWEPPHLFLCPPLLCGGILLRGWDYSGPLGGARVGGEGLFSFFGDPPGIGRDVSSRRGGLLRGGRGCGGAWAGGGGGGLGLGRGRLRAVGGGGGGAGVLLFDVFWGGGGGGGVGASKACLRGRAGGAVGASFGAGGPGREASGWGGCGSPKPRVSVDCRSRFLSLWWACPREGVFVVVGGGAAVRGRRGLGGG